MAANIAAARPTARRLDGRRRVATLRVDVEE